jgi:hypothetical protein
MASAVDGIGGRSGSSIIDDISGTTARTDAATSGAPGAAKMDDGHHSLQCARHGSGE